MRKTVLLIWMVVVFLGVASADEGHHHEALTQEQLGTVHFPVSCSAEAQKTFEKGVALLHSFWYEEAEKTFLEAGKEDSKCAMANWGAAMSLWHQLWDQPGKAILDRGAIELKKADDEKPATERERDYIKAAEAFYSDDDKSHHEARAQAYSDAMEKFKAPGGGLGYYCFSSC